MSGDTVRVRIWYETRTGSEESYAEFDRADWDSWDEQEREDQVGAEALAFFENNCSYGYSTERE